MVDGALHPGYHDQRRPASRRDPVTTCTQRWTHEGVDLKHLQLAITALLVVAAASARAGVVVVIRTESFVAADQSGKATLYVDNDRVRIDSNEGGENYTVIYSTKNGQKYWIVDHDHGAYYEIGEADMAKIKSQIDVAVKQFEDQLKRAPPEQQKYMKQVFEQKMGRPYGEDVRTEYEASSSGVKIGSWECTQYEGRRSGEKSEEVWAASWEDTGIKKDEFAVFGRMARLFEDVGQRTPAFFQFFTRTDGPQGFPVLVVAYREGRRVEKSEVQEIRREDIKPQLFELPEGLTRKAMPGL